MENPASHQKSIIAAGRHIQLVNAGGWEYAERPHVTGIVVIVAITDDGKILLTEQFRRPVDKSVIELPAGLAGDVPGEELEPLATAAHRELLEETGYEAQALEYLTHGPPSAGLSNEVVTFFRARGLKKVGPGGGDHSEAIEVHAVPLASAADWLKAKAAEDVLIDPKVYAGLFFASDQPPAG